MPKRSQYELEREANIARNRALLEQLELKQAVETLGVPKPPVKPTHGVKTKPVQPRKKVKQQNEELEQPRRQSARLRRSIIDPNESPAERRAREAEQEKQRIKEEEAREEAEERARIAKRPRHQRLELATLAETEPQDLSTLSTMLQNIKQVPLRQYPDGDTDIWESTGDKKTKRAVEGLKEKMQELKVVSRAKVTENRIYSAVYHPEVTKDLIFFGDKHGTLGIWDARAPMEEEADEDGDIHATGNEEGGKYWRLQTHWPATSKSSISCIKLDPIDSHKVYTSSYDCTIRSLSFTSGVSEEIYSSQDNLICSIDLNSSGHEMWISDSAGGATHLDLRQDKSKYRRYELSEQKIGCISINPTRPHFILTASNSRSLKIWDVRKLHSIVADSQDESTPRTPASSPRKRAKMESVITSTPVEFGADVVEEFVSSTQGKGCLRGEWPHDKSVSSAYWDPRGRRIVSTSYDDTLRLWDINSPAFESRKAFPEMKPFHQIKHNCQTGKWLTILRAQWTPNPDVYPHFVIANMDHSLNIFSDKGEGIAKLYDATRISAVQAVACLHPNIVERAVTGNASGRCVLWAPNDI